jgi:hypothetical protein
MLYVLFTVLMLRLYSRLITLPPWPLFSARHFLPQSEYIILARENKGGKECRVLYMRWIK